MGGMASGLKFWHFVWFSAPPLPNPSYTPVTKAQSHDEDKGGRSVRRVHIRSATEGKRTKCNSGRLIYE